MFNLIFIVITTTFASGYSGFLLWTSIKEMSKLEDEGRYTTFESIEMMCYGIVLFIVSVIMWGGILLGR